MNFKFKYKYISSGKYERPVIPISIKHGKKSVSILALVDSGADICILPKDIANILNVDLSNVKPEPFSGVTTGRAGKMYKQILEIGVNNYFQQTAVYFSGDLSQNGYAFLGQYGFFDLFKTIQFNKNKSRLLIKK